MQIPLELTFRNVEKTDGLESFIRQEVGRLEDASPDLMSCRLAIERPQEHQKSGSGFRVRIVARVPPRHEIVIRREPGEGRLHDDVHTVLKEAFEACRRRLRELDREQRGEVKRHLSEEETGLVVRIFPDAGYGFVRSLMGREVYFHRNSVLHGDFDRLSEGTQVRFTSEMGEQGLQASSLERLGTPPLQTGRGAGPGAEPIPGW